MWDERCTTHTAKEPCSGPGDYHVHDVEFRMNNVLRGSA